MVKKQKNTAELPTFLILKDADTGMTCLLGGIFFLPLYLPVAAALFSLSGILWLSRMAWTGEVCIRRTSMDSWAVGFALLAAISVWQSVYAVEGWYNYWNLVGLYLLTYALITQTVNSEADSQKIVAVLLISAATVCVWGILQYYTGIDVTAERWIDSEQFPELKTRIFSTLGNPNVLAAFLVMIIGLAAGWSLDVHHGKTTAFFGLLICMAIVCVLLTYSRGAWLTLGVMALMMAAVWKHWSWRILSVGVVAVALLGLAAHESLMPRLLSIRGMFNPADSSVALRWALWESTVAMIEEHPWLGLGWGSYRFVYPEYDFFVQNEAVIIYHGHNTLLSLAAEIGIPGMLCFAIMWGMAAVKALLAMNNAKLGQKGFFLGFAVALLGTAAFSLTDHVLFNIQVAAVFWILVALMAVAPIKGNHLGKRLWFYKKFGGLAGVFGSYENH